MGAPLHERLLSAGIPVVVCRPHEHRDACAPGCDRELDQPAGWNTVTAEQARREIGRYRPGVDALAMVAGHGIDVLDIDTKAGGDPDAVPVNLRAFGRTMTPSGGWHFPVPSTGYGKGDLFIGGRYQGDYVGGTRAGGGRQLAYLPGSTRPRYPAGQYVEVDEWNVDALLDAQPGEGLMAICAASPLSTEASAGRRAVTSAQCRAFLAEHPRGEPECAYGATALSGILKEAQGIVAGDPSRGRHAWACRSTIRVVELMRAGCLDASAFAAVEAELHRRKPEGGTDMNGVLAWAIANATGMTGCTVHGSTTDYRLALPRGPATVDPLDGTSDPSDPVPTSGRRLRITPASTIAPRRVHWLWDGRLALGTLGLLAGREGQGKSTITSWLIAQVTRGGLPGEYAGQSRTVMVAATEDSWAHTIVPRLIAAEADLTRVLRLDVDLDDGISGTLSLPRDLPALRRAALELDVALLVLDPLTSRLSDTLDTHKDADTRRALEPLVRIADDVGMSVVGLMHFNKGGKTDPVEAVMASRAFTAVARSVHTIVRDPDDETRRLFGTPKNNLGRDDLPMLAFTIVGHPVPTTEGTAWTSRVVWGGEVAGTIGEAMERAAAPEDRTATAEAADWLADYMTTQGGRASSADVKAAGRKAGHHEEAIKRARRKLNIEVESVGFPRTTVWRTPVGSQSGHSQGRLSTDPTTTTRPDWAAVGSVGSVGGHGSQPDPTGGDPPAEAAPAATAGDSLAHDRLPLGDPWVAAS